MSAFAGIESASIRGGSSRNFEPGSYVVRLEGLKVVDSKKRPGTKYAIVECNVRSYVPGSIPSADLSEPDIQLPQSTFTEGDDVAWKVNMSLGKVALDNLKGFGLAVMQGVAMENGQEASSIVESQITHPVMDTLFSPNGSPAIGLEMRVDAHVIFTQKTNSPFTKLRWSPAS